MARPTEVRAITSTSLPPARTFLPVAEPPLSAAAAPSRSEVVWNEQANNEGATGGGVSNVFALPSWQANAKVPAPSGSTGRPRRSRCRAAMPIPDDRLPGSRRWPEAWSSVAPAPLLRSGPGLIALNNQQNGKSAGFIQPQIYAAKACVCVQRHRVGKQRRIFCRPGLGCVYRPWLAHRGQAHRTSGGSSATKNKGGKKKQSGCAQLRRALDEGDNGLYRRMARLRAVANTHCGFSSRAGSKTPEVLDPVVYFVTTTLA